MLQRPKSITPILRRESASVAQVPKGIDICVCNEKDTPSITTIASIGTSTGNVLFPTSTDRAVATVTTADLNDSMVDHRKVHYLTIEDNKHGDKQHRCSWELGDL